MATWTSNGRAFTLLDRLRQMPLVMEEINDLTEIVELFARVRAAKAEFTLPQGLTPDEITEDVRYFVRYTAFAMMGRVQIEEDFYSEEDEEHKKLQDELDQRGEGHHQREGAIIARNKLDAMTKGGRYQLSSLQWQQFMYKWSPEFGSLYSDEFKGMWHYVVKLEYYEEW